MNTVEHKLEIPKKKETTLTTSETCRTCMSMGLHMCLFLSPLCFATHSRPCLSLNERTGLNAEKGEEREKGSALHPRLTTLLPSCHGGWRERQAAQPLRNDISTFYYYKVFVSVRLGRTWSTSLYEATTTTATQQGRKRVRSILETVRSTTHTSGTSP